MKRLVLLGLLLLLGLSACNISNPDITPTAEILITDTPTLAISPSYTPSATASITPTQEVDVVPVVVASPLPTQADVNPLPEVTIEPTLGYCEETVREGDSLIGIASRTNCGNEVTFGLLDAIVALNDNIANRDILPAIGSSILIPRPSPTPIPEGANMTETAAARDGVTVFGGSRFVEGQEFGCYEVQERDTLIDIANLYDTDLEVLSQLNRNLNWQGCDFTNPSGGPTCNPGLRIGVCVQVPLPTQTPVPTGTPSGLETATPTPTQEAARIVSPPEGAVASQRVTLEWVSVGILRPDEVYLVTVEDRTTNSSYAYSTRLTNLTLPDELIPTDGQSHTMAWRVTVARRNADNSYTPIGGVGQWHNFSWQSR